MNDLGNKMQSCIQLYSGRPYGVGLIVAGYDDLGPHIYQVSKIRQINSLVISLVKTLVSQNFCQKSVRVNFCNYHNTVWKLRNFAATVLSK